MWKARFYQFLPGLFEAYPNSRWLFLTLTVRNCDITELRATLQHMSKSWQRLKDRKAFRPVEGWIRTTEVTRSKKDGSAHPHYHALLMVPPSMLSGKHYIKHSKWVELWQKCLRADYAPNVDVRAVKTNERAVKTKSLNVNVTDKKIALKSAIAETLKYSTKPSDMVSDESWFLELTKQTHGCRFVAAGGALKHALKLEKETDADLININVQDEADYELLRLMKFNWRSSDKHYYFKKKFQAIKHKDQYY
jgi:hypothetical protein